MVKSLVRIACLSTMMVLAGCSVFAQEDTAGCSDHPLFTRVSGFYISSCTKKEFDVHNFIDPVSKKEVPVEGRLYSYYYYVKKEFRDQKSMLQVARNYTNAIQAIGGTFFIKNANGSGDSWMKVTKDGKETWVSIEQDNWGGNTYYLYIVEKDVMKQEVVADSAFMAGAIGSSGHVAIYGIYFDFDKSDLKPESEPALQEIAKLLTGAPSLKIFVVGHTDNVGAVDYNMKLSQLRADAVVRALTTKYKVSAVQLQSFGLGQLSPVASNKTDEGRAKNRRVELVER